MKRWLSIQGEAIDEVTLQAGREMSVGMGAAVVFVGVVRQSEGEDRIRALEYEAFEKMAVHQFEKIFDQIEFRWPIESIRLVHRVGVVRVNEASLWVEVISPHRAEAFQASQFLVDEMKRVVPIWKKAVKVG